MGLNIKQINELCTGVTLSAELEASELNLRKFLVIYSYIYSSRGNAIQPDKYLNANDFKEIFFSVRIYELPIEYFVNKWDVTEDDLVNEIYINDIKGIDKLEQVLDDYITDYKKLMPDWHTDNLI